MKYERTTLFVQISIELRVLGAFVELRDMSDVAAALELNSNPCSLLLLVVKMRAKKRN